MLGRCSLQQEATDGTQMYVAMAQDRLCVPVSCVPSHHRLGDALYLAQQLPAAKALYRQALELRELCCGPLTCGQAGPQQQLELAASLVKVADVCKVGGCIGVGWNLRVVAACCGAANVNSSSKPHWPASRLSLRCPISSSLRFLALLRKNFCVELCAAGPWGVQ